MKESIIYDLIIIGGGPAGLTAAIYAMRSGLNTFLIERIACGGKMNQTEEICNYPGFENISGFDLSNHMLNNALNLGLVLEYANVINTKLAQDIKYIFTDKEEYVCRSVIIANGLETRKLGVKGESEFKGRGVSYCATCDGFFFKNKTVVVVGGGNTALEDALYLAKICKKVFIFVRKKEFRAHQFLIDEINMTKNIDVMFETQILEILGDEKKVLNKFLIKKQGEEEYFKADGVFIAIGYKPDNEAFSEVHKNEKNFFLADSSGQTNIKGVFVAGDCREKELRQIVTATSDGACSVNSALAFLRKEKFLNIKTTV